MNLFWFLHKNGALNGRSEFRRLVCMGKIYVNSVPIKFDEHYNLELKENDIVTIGEPSEAFIEGRFYMVEFQ